MGRGDKRTRRGKIFKGSYGNSRPNPKKVSKMKELKKEEKKKAKKEKK